MKIDPNQKTFCFVYAVIKNYKQGNMVKSLSWRKLMICMTIVTLISCVSTDRTNHINHNPINQNNAGQGNKIHLGKEFTSITNTELSQILIAPTRYSNKTIKTIGRIASVCNEEGCWIDIWPMDKKTKGVGILVNPLHKAFNFPKDCVGKIAIVEGRYFDETYPQERLEHWHHHGWRPELNIQGPLSIHRIEAIAVEIQ